MGLKNVLWFEKSSFRTLFWLALFLTSWAVTMGLLAIGMAGIVVSFQTGNFWHLIFTPVGFYLGGLMGKVTIWSAYQLVFRT